MNNEYECEWTPTDKEKLLRAVGIEYHNRCETFDRELVKSRATTYGLPIYEAAKRLLPQELISSNRNARNIKAELMQRYNITSIEFKDAAMMGYGQ